MKKTILTAAALIALSTTAQAETFKSYEECVMARGESWVQVRIEWGGCDIIAKAGTPLPKAQPKVEVAKVEPKVQSKPKVEVAKVESYPSDWFKPRGSSATVRVLDVKDIGNGYYAILTNSFWPANPKAYRPTDELVYGVRIFDYAGNEYALMNRDYIDIDLSTVQSYFRKNNFEIGMNFGKRDDYAQAYYKSMINFVSKNG